MIVYMRRKSEKGAYQGHKVQIRLPNLGTAQAFCIYESQAHAGRPSVLWASRTRPAIYEIQSSGSV